MLTPGLAMAEEQQEYNFDPVLITALRRESTDLKTPAAVDVITGEKIKETGASSALEAVKFATGVTIETYGARGSLSSGMTGGISIRGMGKDLGALVMVNGIPINLNGKYELQNIPAQSIERIEIVKGAASTLYGSAALGGVINIITKKHAENSISTEVGSFGTNRETISFHEGKFSMNIVREYTGDMGKMQTSITPAKTTYAPYYTNFGWEAKQTYDFSWDITDKIIFNYRHIDDVYQLFKKVAYTKAASWSQDASLGNMWQQDANDIASFQIKSGSWLHKLYYNGLVRRFVNQNPGGSLANNNSALKNSSSLQYMQTYGIDSQSTWKTGFGDYVAGFAWQKDTYETSYFVGTSAPCSLKQRDLLSFFGQVDHPLSKATSVIVGARQDFVLNQNGLKDLSSFSPQVQFLHKLNKEQSIYANVGKSFRASNWSALYSSSSISTGNPDLQPDEGWSYEAGWKKIGAADSLKIGLYILNFPSYHQWTRASDGVYYAKNTEFRNMGMEVSYDRALKNGWSYNLGVMLGSPETKAQGEDWKQSEARLQITSGINYKKEKWAGSLAATLIGQRPLFSSSTNMSGEVPNSLQANLALSYDISKQTQLSLRIENLLNRIDYTNDSGYITPERAYYVKVTQKF